MRVRWSRAARDDAEAIWEFYAEHDVELARRVLRETLSAIGRLEDHPRVGRPGIVDGTRELVVLGLPHVVIYEIVEREVRILRVHDGRSNWKIAPKPRTD